MNDLYEQIRKSAKALGLSLPEEEMASLAERLDMKNCERQAVSSVLPYLAQRKWQNKVEMYLKMSRLPLKAPKTFENFDFGRLRGTDCSTLEQLPAMANLYARRNLAFIGSEGVERPIWLRPTRASAVSAECNRTTSRLASYATSW